MTDLQNRVIKRSREKISRFTKNKYNPKHHPRIQKDRLQAVLEKFGQVGEIYVWQSERNGGDWTIFDGHARRELDPDQEWDIAWTSLTDPEVDELVLYYDPLAALAKQERSQTMALMAGLEVQERALKEMLEEQAQALGFTFGGSGGDVTDEDGVVIDRAEELQKVWQVAAGDVWEVESKSVPGKRHRVMCGDNTDASGVARLMPKKAAAAVTDPPYGIGLDTDYTRFTSGRFNVKNKTHPPVIGDNKRFDPRPFLGYDSVVLWGANFYGEHLPIGTWLVWDKRFKDGEAFLSDAELAWVKSGYGIYILSLTSQGCVRPERVQHPTQKPVELFVWCIEKCKAGESVYDPFLGSGTTIIACEQTGRIGYGMEIHPPYVAVTLERLQNLGLEPKRVGQA